MERSAKSVISMGLDGDNTPLKENPYLAGLLAVGPAHPNRLPVWTRWHRDRPKPRSRPAAPDTRRCASTLSAPSLPATETRAAAIVSIDRAPRSPAAARHRRAPAIPVRSAA